LRRKVLKAERELATLVEKYDERALHLHREMEQVSKSHEHIRSEIAMLTRNVEREERVQRAVREEMERLAEIRRQEELRRSQEAAARSIQKHARGYVARKSIALLKAEASAKKPARKGRRR
jgi:predicted RNase H-like nuclease (RuvC/YqgF family)